MATSFISTWTTTANGQSITLPINNINTIANVTWGDVTSTTNMTHIYTNAGEYQITVDFVANAVPTISFSNNPSNANIKSITAFGAATIADGGNQFRDCINLTSVPGTVMVLPSNCSSMFQGCIAFIGNLAQWNVQNVTDMNSMFFGCEAFNGDLTLWNVQNVTYMSGMFYGCKLFNGDLTQWDVQKVTDMRNMFYGCGAFIEGIFPLAQNNMVTYMSGMFYGCKLFNGDLTQWNVQKVPDMRNMFYGCEAFIEGIFPLAQNNMVTDMRNMFRGCKLFNGDLTQWNVQNVESMSNMFYGCESFIEGIFPLAQNNMVNNMNSMFYGCKAFNGDLTQWDVQKVTDMSSMFKGCEAFIEGIFPLAQNNMVKYITLMFYGCKLFNGDLTQWNVQKVTDMSNMFYGCEAFTTRIFPLAQNNMVNNMSGMFIGCKLFNGDLTQWNVQNVESMRNMFYGCEAFIERIFPLAQNNMVTDMYGMFYGCKLFNGDLTEWNVQKVTDMRFMFDGCIAFKKDISKWNLSSITQDINFPSLSNAYIAEVKPKFHISTNPDSWAFGPTITDGVIDVILPLLSRPLYKIFKESGRSELVLADYYPDMDIANANANDITDQYQYSTNGKKGFYYKLNGITFTARNLTASDTQYYFTVTQTFYTTPNPSPVTISIPFYYDKVIGPPILPTLTFDNFNFNVASSTSFMSYVSGISVIRTSTSPIFLPDINITNMGLYFYQKPLLTYTFSLGCTGSVSVQAPSSHTTDASGQVTVNVALSPNVSLVYNKQVKVDISAYNLAGSSGASMILNAIFDVSSYALINSMPSAILSVSSPGPVKGFRIYSAPPITGIIPVPKYCYSEANPVVSFKDFSYNHQWSLIETDVNVNIATSSYSINPSYELQIASGLYQSKGNNNTKAYINYSNTFNNNNVDYSGVSTTDYRYASFMWKFNAGAAANISYTFTLADFKKNGVAVTINTPDASGSYIIGTDPRIILYYRIEDESSPLPTGTPGTTSTLWVDANTNLSSTVAGFNKYDPSAPINGSNCYGPLDLIRPATSYKIEVQSGNLVFTTSAIRYNGNTPASYLHCRIGLPMSVNYSFSYVSLTLS